MKKLIALLIILAGCASDRNISDRYEGIRDGKLRVVVRIDAIVIPENFTDEELLSYVADSARERGYNLLKSFVEENAGDKSSEISSKISSSLKVCEKVYLEEDEKRIDAAFDFDVKEIYSDVALQSEKIRKIEEDKKKSEIKEDDDFGL